MSVWPFVLISSLATAAPLRGKVDHAQFVPNEARISLSTVCGEVAVRGESKRQLRISGLIKEDGELQISNEGNHFRLEMRGIHQRRNQDMCAYLELTVPPGVRLEVRSVSADVKAGALTNEVKLVTVSGSVQLGPGAREAVLETVSGSINATGISRSLTAETVSGDVELLDVNGEAMLESVSGDLEVQGSFDRLRAETVSGGLTVKGPIEASGRARIESHSGNVQLTIPKAMGGVFELETFSGTLRADDAPPPIRERYGPGASLTFTRGTGGADVSIRTFSGNAEVLAR